MAANHSFNGATSPNHLFFHSLGATFLDHLSHSFTWYEYSRKIYLGCRRSLLLNGSHFLSLLSAFPPLEISFPFSVWLPICFFRFNKVGMYSSIQSWGESSMNINRQLHMWLPKQQPESTLKNPTDSFQTVALKYLFFFSNTDRFLTDYYSKSDIL